METTLVDIISEHLLNSDFFTRNMNIDSFHFDLVSAHFIIS